MCDFVPGGGGPLVRAHLRGPEGSGTVVLEGYTVVVVEVVLSNAAKKDLFLRNP